MGRGGHVGPHTRDSQPGARSRLAVILASTAVQEHSAGVGLSDGSSFDSDCAIRPLSGIPDVMSSETCTTHSNRKPSNFVESSSLVFCGQCGSGNSFSTT